MIYKAYFNLNGVTVVVKKTTLLGCYFAILKHTNDTKIRPLVIMRLEN